MRLVQWGFSAAFHDLNAQGIFEVAGVSLAIVVVVGLSFWLSAILWRSLGVGFRNASRFLVSRLPALLATTLFIASVAASLLQLGPTASVPAVVSTAVQRTPAEPSQPQFASEPPQALSFQGEGWFIPHDRLTYDKVVQKEAAQRCQDRGKDWALGDRRDFEDLGGELLKAGHRGSFWTASRRPNENLDFFLEPDGSSHFRWALSANDTKRIVLCVRAAAL